MKFVKQIHLKRKGKKKDKEAMEVPILLPYITVQYSKSMSYEEHHFFQFPSDVYP